MQTTHRKSVHACMVSTALLQNIRRLSDLLNCRISSKVKPAQFWRTYSSHAERWLAPNEFWYRQIEQLIPNANCCLTTVITGTKGSEFWKLNVYLHQFVIFILRNIPTLRVGGRSSNTRVTHNSKNCVVKKIRHTVFRKTSWCAWR